MVKVNKNYGNLKENYLFADIARKVSEYQGAHPEANIIRMGIGDVTLPLCEEVIKGLHGGVDDMAKAETFKGYGPEQGYGFLQEAVKGYYASYGVSLEANEIFISDGAKRYLYQTVQRVMWEISLIYLTRTIRYLFPIRYIPYMSTPTPWTEEI